MEMKFEAIADELQPSRWAEKFRDYWPAYCRWFLSEDIEARQTYWAGVKAIKKWMPELLPLYELACERVGGGDLEARFLSFFCPPPYLSGCSQAVWLKGEPILVRNYDYAPGLCDGVLLNSNWNGRNVVGITDGLLGLVDGMNDDGLVVSLTFGGRRVVGYGFGMPILLRYVLEFCTTTSDAVRVLCRIPTHMAYNVTILDKTGDYATLFLSPDRTAHVTKSRVATNHQKEVEWHRHARITASVEREEFLLRQMERDHVPTSEFEDAFLLRPLYSTNYDRGFGTIYTSIYRPKSGVMDLVWPGTKWRHDINAPTHGTHLIKFPDGPNVRRYSS